MPKGKQNMEYKNRRWVHDGNGAKLIVKPFENGPEQIALEIARHEPGRYSYESKPMGVYAKTASSGALDKLMADLESEYGEYLKNSLTLSQSALRSYYAGRHARLKPWLPIMMDTVTNETNTFACPWCDSYVTLETYMPKGAGPDYDFCPYCGRPVDPVDEKE